MPIISIYNNKGGVGKSTLTVGLAEFLAANKKQQVLVIDLDAQASSSGALLGRQAVVNAIAKNQTVAASALNALRSRRPLNSLNGYVQTRPASASRSVPLPRLDVLVPEKPGIV